MMMPQRQGDEIAVVHRANDERHVKR